MEASFSNMDVYNFLKTLVEIGGVHYIDKDHCVFRSADNTPVGVKIGSGKDCNKQIALFKEGCKPPPNAIYLNPFDELLGAHPERDWFMNTISVMPGCLLLHTMKTMVDLINHKTKDTKFKTAQVLSKFVDRVDEKFAQELQKVNPLSPGVIFYDKQKHVAQLQCDFWNEDLVEKYNKDHPDHPLTSWFDQMSKKMRKSSIQLIRDMTVEIYGTETPEEITYTATVLACPKFDAVTHVLVEAISRIAKILEKIKKIDLHVDELREHLNHIEAYHKALQWLATSSATSAKSVSETDAKVGAVTSVPWKVQSPVTSSGLPANVVTAGGAGTGFLGNVEAVGVTKNPMYGGGVTKNPNFGLGGSFLGNVGVFDPGIPGLGRVAPVIPSVQTPDFSKIASDAYNSMGYGTGFGGGFI